MDAKFIQNFDLILVYSDPWSVPEVYNPIEIIAYHDWIYKEGSAATDFEDHYNRHVLVIDTSGVES